MTRVVGCRVGDDCILLVFVSVRGCRGDNRGVATVAEIPGSVDVAVKEITVE